MADINDLVMEQLQKGHHCSQAMVQMALDLQGKEDPLLVRAVGGLGGGMFAQRTCGTLTGAVCALSTYVPRAEGEPEPVLYQQMAKELVEWFEAENGSLECRDLVEFQKDKIMAFCPGLMARTFEKILEILEKNGIDPYGQG